MDKQQLLKELKKSPYFSSCNVRGDRLEVIFGKTTYCKCNLPAESLTPETLSFNIRLVNSQVSRELLRQAGYEQDPLQNVEILLKLQALERASDGSTKELFDELYKLVHKAVIVKKQEDNG